MDKDKRIAELEELVNKLSGESAKWAFRAGRAEGRLSVMRSMSDSPGAIICPKCEKWNISTNERCFDCKEPL